MSTINTKATKSNRRTGLSRTQDAQATAASHSNFMAGTSYDVTNPLARLRMAAASSFFGERCLVARPVLAASSETGPGRVSSGI